MTHTAIAKERFGSLPQDDSLFGMKSHLFMNAALIFLLSFFGVTVHAKEVVRLSTGEWSPFISETLEQNGLIAQLTREAFANVGIEIELGFFPWARTTELSKAGNWDGTIAFVRLAEREKAYLYSDVLYTGQYVFFHLKTFSFEWNDYKDLKNIVLSTTRGYGGMGEKFIEAEKNGTIRVMRVTSDVQSYNMLLRARVQAVPSDLEVGYINLHRLYGKDVFKFTHHPKVINNAEYHLVISKRIKKGPYLIAKFNEGLKALHKSGRYKEILKTWYNKPIYKDSLPAPILAQMIKEKVNSK